MGYWKRDEILLGPDGKPRYVVDKYVPDEGERRCGTMSNWRDYVAPEQIPPPTAPPPAPPVRELRDILGSAARPSPPELEALRKAIVEYGTGKLF